MMLMYNFVHLLLIDQCLIRTILLFFFIYFVYSHAWSIDLAEFGLCTFPCVEDEKGSLLQCVQQDQWLFDGGLTLHHADEVAIVDRKAGSCCK